MAQHPETARNQKFCTLDKLDAGQRGKWQEISDRVIDLWRQYQDELAMHGVTARAKQLDRQVWLAMGMARAPTPASHQRL